VAYPERIASAVRFIQENLGIVQAGTVGLVLGTGLSPVAQAIEAPKALPYEAIPGFPRAGAPGHEGRLVSGLLGGRPVLALSGRFHLYEGFEAAEACLPLRTLGMLGARTLILTNAAGALNPAFRAGSLMLVTDHINHTGHNPLRGPNVEALGERFPDLSRAYDPKLRELASAQAARLDIRIEQGVYLQVLGPSIETPAETRAFRLLGADAVGMSLAIETVAARHMGLRVLAISCLTNANDPDDMQPVPIEMVLAAASGMAGDLARLLAAVLAALD
jgi:purine-nucleoside phosphorylase